MAIFDTHSAKLHAMDVFRYAPMLSSQTILLRIVDAIQSANFDMQLT
jgi:hypothetical protein